MNILEDIIYPIFDEIGPTMEKRDRELLIKSPDTQLFGEGGVFDSLGLVSFIVALEERIQDVYGRTVAIADSRAMSRKSSPFLTVASITEYIQELLEDPR